MMMLPVPKVRTERIVLFGERRFTYCGNFKMKVRDDVNRPETVVITTRQRESILPWNLFYP